jgi:hypothetical protein
MLAVFRELSCLRAFLGDVSAVLVIRRLEIKALTLVLLSVSLAGAAVMALNGKSRIDKESSVEVCQESAKMLNTRRFETP